MTTQEASPDSDPRCTADCGYPALCYMYPNERHEGCPRQRPSGIDGHRESEAELDLTHVRRRTIAERDYWLDQLISEVRRLRSDNQLPREALSGSSDSALIDLLEAAHVGVEAFTMDDQNGEPTRKMWCVEGADASCIMPSFCEAIERAKEKGYLPITASHEG